MYIGRFVVLGRTTDGDWYLGYRVSSRSFPNRYIRPADDRAIVLPTADAPSSDNPYISYNCLRAHASSIIVANGSHVDPIIDKVKIGYGLRDAMALSLLALDYEHDRYNTPRVAAALDVAMGAGYLGIVAEDKILVRRMEVMAGKALLIATYELTDPTPIVLAENTPEDLACALYECGYEHPVAALAVMPGDGELRIAVSPAG